MKKHPRLLTCALIGAGLGGLSLCIILLIFGLYMKSGYSFIQTPVPGETLARGKLQADTLNFMWPLVIKQMPILCQNPHVANTEPMEEINEIKVSDEGSLTAGKWVERWTVEQCATQSVYRIVFEADGVGGAYIHVSPWQ